MKSFIKIFFAGAAFIGVFTACEINSDEPGEPKFKPFDAPEPHLHEIAQAFQQPMSENLFFSRDVIISPTDVMQTFCLTRSGRIYYSQAIDDVVYVTRGTGPDSPAWSVDQAMKLKFFGHGCTLVTEETADGKTYVWVGSNGQQKNNKKYYWGELSVSRIPFESGVSYEEQAGDTYFFTGHVGLIVNIDFDNRRFLAGTFILGRYYATTFDLDEVLALPEKDITFTNKINGQQVTRTVKGRDLADLTPLGQFWTLNSAPDKENDVLSYNHQGQCIYGDYVYIFEGDTVTVEDGKNCKAYVTVYDIKGNNVIPRTEIKAANDRDAWFDLGYLGSLEPEGMYVREDGVYLGFVSKPTVSKNPRKSHILKYQCDLCK